MRTRVLAMPFVERPLTLPRDLFAIIGTTGWSMLDRNSHVISLGAGARYGVDENLEVGIDLLRLTMSPHPTTGLADPIGSLTYRLTKGVAELGAHAELVIPTSSSYGAAIGLPFLLHLGSFARFDLAPSIAASNGGRWTLSVGVPAELRVQLGSRFTLGGGAWLDVPDLDGRAIALRPVARASWTFGDKTASADLGVVAAAPEVMLKDDRPKDPWYGNYPSLFFELRVFVADDPRRDEGDHLW